MIHVGLRRRWLWLAAIALASLVAFGSGQPAAYAGTASATRAIAVPGTFVSLLRLCRDSPPRDALLTGCRNGHYVEDLEQFSSADGRRIGAVTPLSSGAASVVPPPAAASNDTVLLTETVGARCLDHGKPIKRVMMECVPSPQSCINTVLALSPHHPTPTRLFAVSTAQLIGAAVPSPDGTEVAYSSQPCVGTQPAPALYVRDLETGTTRAVVTTNYCSSIGRPSWNAAGTKVAFRYERVTARPQPAPIGSSGPDCPVPVHPAWGLETVGTAPGDGAPVTLPPPHDCSLDAAAFDATGLLVAEGCAGKHLSMSSTGATRGPVELVQYNGRNKVSARIPLPHRGLDPLQTLIANEPGSDRLLITQDQPNGLVARDDDHIYELNGTHLRQIVENSWGSDFMAVPW